MLHNPFIVFWNKFPHLGLLRRFYCRVSYRSVLRNHAT